MKKLVIGVVVVVLVLLLAPKGVGSLAEKRLDEGIDRLVEQAPYLTVVDKKWTGGWFKSEQVVTFEVFSAWVDAVSPKVLEDAMKKEAEGAGGGVEQAGEPAVVAAPDAVPPSSEESRAG